MTRRSPSPSPAPAASPRRLALTAPIDTVISALRDLRCPVVLGASGGVDSSALMLLIAHAQVPMIAVHVHHHLREDADRDLHCVQRQAQQLQVPFCAVHLPPPTALEGENIAARSRRLRYDALCQIASEYGADVITAHHAEDLLETFLMRVARGVGLPRAFGLQPVMRWHDTNVRRPALALWKQDLRTIVETAKFPWIEDTSNASDAYARNRLRHTMGPLIEELQRAPHFGPTLASLAAQADALRQKDSHLPDLDTLRTPLPARFGNPKPPEAHGIWIPRDHCMARYDRRAERAQTALYRWCNAHNIMPRRDVLSTSINALWRGKPSQCELRGLTLRTFADGLWLLPGAARRLAQRPPTTATQRLHEGRWTRVGAHRLKIVENPFGTKLFARPIRDGDRFASPHSGRMIGVRKRMTRDGVPSAQRDDAVVILAQIPPPPRPNMQFLDGSEHKNDDVALTTGHTVPRLPRTTHDEFDQASPTIEAAPIVGVVHGLKERLEIRTTEGMRLVIDSERAVFPNPATS